MDIEQAILADEETDYNGSVAVSVAAALDEVGQQFGVTQERIRQIEAKAIRKLRHSSRSKKLRDFLD